MQIDPIKPSLKAPGTNLLTIKCNKPLSTFAFKLNLRRYTKDNNTTNSAAVEAMALRAEVSARRQESGLTEQMRLALPGEAGGLLRTSTRPMMNPLLLLSASV